MDALFQEEQRLAFRLLTVREHIAEEIADYLPEMLRTGIQQANMQQRREQLERMTQVEPSVSEVSSDSSSGIDSEAASDVIPEQSTGSDSQGTAWKLPLA